MFRVFAVCVQCNRGYYAQPPCCGDCGEQKFTGKIGDEQYERKHVRTSWLDCIFGGVELERETIAYKDGSMWIGPWKERCAF
jgi:hypothetical protein